MQLATIEYLTVVVFLFVLGSIVGSLLNVCIYRLPREETLWAALKRLLYPPSHCPRCQQRIRFYDNIPILGWLWLRGRCRNCRGRISIRYPLVELLTATLFVVVYWCEIPDWWSWSVSSCLRHSYGPSDLSGGNLSLAMQHWRYALHMVLIVALIIATFIDFDLRIIPDSVTLPAMAAGTLGNLLLGYVYIVPIWYQTDVMWADFPREAQVYFGKLPEWLAMALNFIGMPAWVTAHPLLHGVLMSVAGILAGGGIVWGVRLAGAWGLRREAMGFGDVVLLAMIGSFIGWQATLVVFILAPLCAIIAVALAAVFRFEREIPFGPYLSLATLILLLGWRWIWPHFEPLLSLGPFLTLAAAFLFAALCGSLYLMRILLKLLGFQYPEYGLEEPVEWTAGDQLAHFAGECVDDRQGQWPQDGRWRGELTGRGQAHQRDWRRRG